MPISNLTSPTQVPKVLHMTDMKRLRPLAKEACADCGGEFLATRGDAAEVDLDTLRCDTCEMWHEGYEEGRKAGTEEQPEPEPAEGDMWALVIQDMRGRRELGIERYGTPLQAGNGRDPLVDAYQESLDRIVYIRQELEERQRRVDEARADERAKLFRYLRARLDNEIVDQLESECPQELK